MGHPCECAKMSNAFLRQCMIIEGYLQEQGMVSTGVSINKAGSLGVSRVIILTGRASTGRRVPISRLQDKYRICCLRVFKDQRFLSVTK